MIHIAIYYRQGLYSFLPAGTRDRPVAEVGAGANECEVDYAHDVAFLSYRPGEAFGAGEFYLAAKCGFFGLKLVEEMKAEPAASRRRK